MSGMQAGHSTALEQAVISKNRDFLYTFLELQEETKEKMVRSLPDRSIIPLLEVLTEMFENKEMRYEVILTIRMVISWRRDVFKSVAMEVVSKDGEKEVSEHTERINSLKRILISISKEKVDLNKIYELKGRLSYIRDSLEERAEERTEEKENVPVCREQ
ncbi:hypothetical protein NEAUS04_2349 [Nematocida ausubeli]|uniref:Small-subunit processome Utp12 domain-containing protein n=1 Tax=Nematocida ausubeli (strain ATCC PRA-371 / ERTm2) TaxID=1913371 RepID=A0A086J2M2_NEMA1|nr:uncharacterized protein NESG_01512 [Nematocida ausubeli]KAI5133958.1 hypothetical protein NEAUS07_0654 [Nematocida ausubeli]KAI5146948.1 hypothetical protein NEAUS05_0284 [Nematocida ausubeli]KAI5159373.1 hypothetical protein NEAUS03_0245 [Nematocida ausubeli]KAI5164897.1 hypothetical protein NEAUS04_2349 [Nematocida ausubeli]KFG26390.1 hypothetical protein NESG_01512 [Nematocida ausubeli]